MKNFGLILFCLGLPFLMAHGAVPSRITYQGRLSKSGVGAAGKHTITVQFITASGEKLPASQTFDVDVPVSGDFSLNIDNIPPDADWINGLPKMRVIVGGETLTPDQSFSATPYALVARNVENLDTSKVKLSGTDGDLLSSWQSPSNKGMINAAVIVGTITTTTDHGVNHALNGSDHIPAGTLSPTQIKDTALVLTSSVTQTIQPTQPVVPLAVKGQPNTGPNFTNMFEVWDNAAVPSKQFHIQGFGTAYFKGKVGIGTLEPSDQLEVVGNIRMLNGNKQILFNDPGNYDFSIVHNGGTSLDIRSPELDLTIASFSNNGNVGIGTWTPSAKLEVAGGDMKVGGSITLLNDLRIKREGAVPAQYDFQILPIMTNDKSDLQILPDAPETGIGIYTRNSAGTAKLGLGINKDGYVGVNKTDPTKPLDVAGDANISGKIISSAVGINNSSPTKALDVVGDTNIAGKVGINNPTPTKALDVVGDANISGKITGATFGFGGMYSTSDVGSANVVNNPLTGGKSCPAGFLPFHAMRFRTAEPEAGADLYICIKY